jgi:hypothetical protein
MCDDGRYSFIPEALERAASEFLRKRHVEEKRRETLRQNDKQRSDCDAPQDDREFDER